MKISADSVLGRSLLGITSIAVLLSGASNALATVFGGTSGADKTGRPPGARRSATRTRTK